MDKFCHSCAAPLTEEFKGAAEYYCKFCSDEQGNLKSRGEVRRGIAEWFKGWQPNLDDETALARADAYLNAMPAWAE